MIIFVSSDVSIRSVLFILFPMAVFPGCLLGGKKLQ